jgi:predicted kinase
MITIVARTRLERDVARILEGVEPAPLKARRPALLVLVGLPATGKTRIASELRRRTGAVVLESDAIRSLLVRQRRYTPPENRRLFAAIHGAIDALLADGVSVILDATNVAEVERKPLYAMAGQRDAKLILVHVTAPDGVARERLERRRNEKSQSEADLRVYERMQSRVEEVRRPHHVIDTSGEIEPALRALAKEMMDS